jgi:hypothetical protein
MFLCGLDLKRITLNYFNKKNAKKVWLPNYFIHFQQDKDKKKAAVFINKLLTINGCNIKILKLRKVY